jgi:hypothetical protein
MRYWKSSIEAKIVACVMRVQRAEYLKVTRFGGSMPIWYREEEEWEEEEELWEEFEEEWEEEEEW